jgi:hypothetical protein
MCVQSDQVGWKSAAYSKLAKDVAIGAPVPHAVSQAADAIAEDDLLARWQATAKALP